MKVNPVYRQEMRAGARSFRLPLILTLFNGTLGLVALLDMYAMVVRVRTTAEIRYSAFLSLFLFVAAVEFILLLLIVPGLTAGSISGERERRTLDLLLTTRLTPKSLILGKLCACLSTVFFLILSSLPVFALVFVYGGVEPKTILILFASYLVTAALTGSIGIFCSALFQRTTVATIASYAVVLLLTGGTLAAARFAASLRYLPVMGGNRGGPGGNGLLLLNPAVSFLQVLSGQTGSAGALFAETFRTPGPPAAQSFSVSAWQGMVLQLLAAGLLLFLTERRLKKR